MEFVIDWVVIGVETGNRFRALERMRELVKLFVEYTYREILIVIVDIKFCIIFYEVRIFIKDR